MMIFTCILPVGCIWVIHCQAARSSLRCGRSELLEYGVKQGRERRFLCNL